MLAPVISLPEWSRRRSGAVTADVRWSLDGRDGRAAYAAGHLPGAVWVDLDAALAGPPGDAAGRHPLPEPAAFAAALGALGVGPETPVLAYDDQGGVFAARLVWMLRVLGHPAALVDGGLRAYAGPLETGEATPASAALPVRPWPAERLAGAEDALDPARVVLDARPAERYAGEAEPVDPRAGHVPGARSLPVREHLGPDGRLLDDDALRGRFAAVGAAEADADVVAYCGSGVTACHNLLLLEHLGLAPGRLYPGSWSAYSRSSRPLATGRDRDAAGARHPAI